MTSKKVQYPSFLIVGAARSGTTSLFHYLNSHPEIYFPKVKEPSFFAFADERVEFCTGEPNFVTKFDKYLKLFDPGPEILRCGEASTPYLYFYEKTIRNIKKYLPDPEVLRILIILRNPVERAFSQYLMRVRDLKENLSFEQAVQVEKERIHQNFHFDYFYVDRGFYYKQVKSYLENFRQVRVFLYEDLKEDRSKLLREVFQFLQVNPGFECHDAVQHNRSGIPKLAGLHYLLVKDNLVKSTAKELLPDSIRKNLYSKLLNLDYKYNLDQIELSQETRERLIDTYREDVVKLGSLIDCDLSAWLR